MGMILRLNRLEFGETYTIGELYVDGKWECYTLEDKVRPAGEKVYGQTAIPVGQYKVIVNVSNRFKRLLPLLLDVPQFEGVRIHPGNRPEDTEGCILVGRKKDNGTILESRLAFTPLLEKIKAACDSKDTVWLEIYNS